MGADKKKTMESAIRVRGACRLMVSGFAAAADFAYRCVFAFKECTMRHKSTDSSCSIWLRKMPGLLFAAVFTFCLSSDVGAQQELRQNDAIQGEQSIQERFASVLQSLSQRMKVTFVVEGQPSGTRSDVMPTALQADLSNKETMGEEVVKRLADYYDYSASRVGNVFVLTKLYTNPADIPDVTPEECRQALQTASQILAIFNPRIPPGDRTGDPQANIARLLTPQQAHLLSSEGLPVASLSPGEREEAWRLALYYYVQNQAQSAEYTTDFLGDLTTQNPLFHWLEIADVNAFGYDFTSTTAHKVVFLPISHPNRVLVAPNGTTVTSDNNENDTAAYNANDPTSPPKRITVTVPSASLSGAMNLRQAMTELNGLPTTKARCQVDTAFAAKSVMIVGKEKATAAEIMDALANLYGLRVLHKDDGTLLLTRRRDPSTQDIMSLGKVLRTIMPPPLLRALHARMKAQQRPLPPMQQAQARLFLEGDYQEAASAMRLTAIQQLRALAEPRVQAAKGKQLPLSALGEYDKKLLVLSLAIRPLADICWLAERPVPPYIADFDHVLLTGGAY